MLINRYTGELAGQIAENIAKTKYTVVPSVPKEYWRNNVLNFLGNGFGLLANMGNPVPGIINRADLVPPNLGSLAPIIAKEVGEKAERINPFIGKPEPKFMPPFNS